MKERRKTKILKRCESIRKTKQIEECKKNYIKKHITISFTVVTSKQNFISPTLKLNNISLLPIIHFFLISKSINHQIIFPFSVKSKCFQSLIKVLVVFVFINLSIHLFIYLSLIKQVNLIHFC